MNNHPKKYSVDLMLLAVTIVWGYTFVTIKISLDNIPPFQFIGLRFFLATLTFFILFSRRIIKELNVQIIKAGLFSGAVFFAAYAFQTTGLQYTSATNAGFITGLFVIMVPFMSIFISRKIPSLSTFIGVVIATFGLFLLTYRYGSIFNYGDFLIFLCAVAIAYHLILLGHYSPLHDTFPLAFIQMVVVCGLGVLFHFPLETTYSFWTPQIIWSLIVTGIFASAAALTIQTYAQKYVSPTRTAIILTMEPVFAGIFGYLVLTETLALIN